ncbi:MAG TPA: HU family DNA-binding protein [Candidatus Cloacimonadota bacterium]|jgi:DNA-binding protein HU-beta|nr:HU family DNA-binding protein [Candidatus Cloacimonadales bacterium]HPY95761.1 HU family DNA-binding protein [Candidatus Cloacimonadota bacterium]HQB40291.1 HU family DNA-binding protein [Candidatus Cloacimonadota bacterium]
MTKDYLVRKIAEDAKLTIKQANIVVNSFINEITEALCQGEKVSFVGFGSFSVTERKERQGINPSTKEKITISARKVPVFKAGAELKKFVKSLD